MGSFMIRFLICNALICGVIGILLIATRALKSTLTVRARYNLWLILFVLLAIPFIPIQPVGFPRIISWFNNILNTHSATADPIRTGLSGAKQNTSINWMGDFTLSVSRKAPSFAGWVLFGIWIAGIVVMIIIMTRSFFRLRALKKSSLPLQSETVRELYNRCLNECGISKYIPVFSAAFLKSPVIIGLFMPHIYLPIHVISDYKESELRYMLLHELQHYKYHDALANYLMNIIGILYWFNPFVWRALKEARNDREIACDTSVLKMLKEDDYEDYGNTLINFAEKISLIPFPFVAEMSGNMKQLEKRIINIGSYKKPTKWKWTRSVISFGMIVILLVCLAPVLSTYATDENKYQWNTTSENISYTDLSSYFGSYDGSFVLYDSANNAWNLYDLNRATLRVAPNSTYKIYTALFGLEENIITPDASLIEWNHEQYPFDAWNTDQTLPSAMGASVNWYFQSIDKQLGAASINNYVKKIGYGNENISGDLSTYWMESSLKISPVEQVKLLRKLYNNSFSFKPENINAVKESICLSASESGKFYGKTGTGRVDGKDINGWFIGYAETSDNTYFFATNIKADSNATGSDAARITMSVLSDMSIWN